MALEAAKTEAESKSVLLYAVKINIKRTLMMHYRGIKESLYKQQLWGQSLSSRFPAQLHHVLCPAIRFLEVELLCRLKGALRTSLVLGAAGLPC